MAACGGVPALGARSRSLVDVGELDVSILPILDNY